MRIGFGKQLGLSGGAAGAVLLAALLIAAAPAASGALPLAGKVVAIDPGHNQHNFEHLAQISKLVPAGGFRKTCDTTGTQTANGYSEAAYSFNVATRLARILRAAGATVVLTRNQSTPWGPCINERAAIGNRAHADAAISIHADGGPIAGRGFEVIHPPDRGSTLRIAIASARLAIDVRNAYAAGTGMPYAAYVGKGGLDVRSDLGGLNLSTVPKVFIETGNMHNPADAALLESSTFRQRAAIAIASGLKRFLLH
jgi:N-acetylmuramoyl-L-alanine amidase